MSAEHEDTFWTLAKTAILWAISFFTHSYHEIAGNILVTASIAYLIWKWRRDIKKANDSEYDRKA